MSRKRSSAPAPPKRGRASWWPDDHVFHRSGIPTRTGGPEGCADCPLPARHPVHIDPPANPIAADEARRLGEERP